MAANNRPSRQLKSFPFDISILQIVRAADYWSPLVASNENVIRLRVGIERGNQKCCRRKRPCLVRPG
jgi:hypothetical protein